MAMAFSYGRFFRTMSVISAARAVDSWERIASFVLSMFIKREKGRADELHPPLGNLT